MQFVLSLIIKLTLWFLRILPASLALFVGRACGFIMYCVDAKHRQIAYQNLKYAFLPEKSLGEIRCLTRKYFMNLGANFAEFLRLPLQNPANISRIVACKGFDHIDEAMKAGKGLVAMTMHYGNWEFTTLELSLTGYTQNIIFKPQENASAFNEVMISCRKNAYKKFERINVFEKGAGARQLLGALRNNEMVGLLADQGGKEGVPVKFFGRQARFSLGGIKLALKTGAAIHFGAIYRRKGLNHELIADVFKPETEGNDENEKELKTLQQLAYTAEEMIRQSPEQYMWMYKIWKYDPSKNIMILDDGRVGHLRQSQAVARTISSEVESRGGNVQEKTVAVRYKNKFFKICVLLTALVHRFIPGGIRLKILKAALTDRSCQELYSMKADMVISAGSYSAPLNCLMAAEHQTGSVTLLRPSILPYRKFSLVLLPEHDRKRNGKLPKNVVFTKGAPNLITDDYLQKYAGLIQRRYSHLKLRDKFTVGLLLGGDTKDYILDEAQAKILTHQIQEVAEQLDADILITTSRRTSEKVDSFFIREFKKYPRCQLLIIANRNNVPEAVGGILALSDVLVVTGDSISMVSEAASSGKRTVVVPIKKRSESAETHKHNRFVDRLNAKGYILCSEPRMLKQSIFNLAKNKIWTRKLDDSKIIHESILELL